MELSNIIAAYLAVGLIVATLGLLLVWLTLSGKTPRLEVEDKANEIKRDIDKSRLEIGDNLTGVAFAGACVFSFAFVCVAWPLPLIVCLARKR